MQGALKSARRGAFQTSSCSESYKIHVASRIAYRLRFSILTCFVCSLSLYICLGSSAYIGRYKRSFEEACWKSKCFTFHLNIAGSTNIERIVVKSGTSVKEFSSTSVSSFPHTASLALYFLLRRYDHASFSAGIWSRLWRHQLVFLAVPKISLIWALAPPPTTLFFHSTWPSLFISSLNVGSSFPHTLLYEIILERSSTVLRRQVNVSLSS